MILWFHASVIQGMFSVVTDAPKKVWICTLQSNDCRPQHTSGAVCMRSKNVSGPGPLIAPLHVSVHTQPTARILFCVLCLSSNTARAGTTTYTAITAQLINSKVAEVLPKIGLKILEHCCPLGNSHWPFGDVFFLHIIRQSNSLTLQSQVRISSTENKCNLLR